MKKITCVMIAVMTLILCFTLSACRYASGYSSTGMTEKKTSDNASVSFGSFSGTYVIKLQNKGDDEAYITYMSTLGEGNIKVYYDLGDEKLDLFEIESGGVAEGKTETFTGNKTIYIIIESDGKASAGSFSFALKKSEK